MLGGEGGNYMLAHELAVCWPWYCPPSWSCNIDLSSLSLAFILLIPSWFCNVYPSFLSLAFVLLISSWFCSINVPSLSLVFTLLMPSVSYSWCSLVKLIFPSSSLLSYFFSSVIFFSVLWEVTLERRRTGLACNFFGCQLLLNFFRHVGIGILDFLIPCWWLDLLICAEMLFEAPCLQLIVFASAFRCLSG